jgi:tripartite-type tricarboxylate transporter receptor subunit TctC
MILSLCRKLLPALAVSAVVGFMATAAKAEDPAAFFKGKTVRLIVGFGAGGGYDAYARMIEPYLAKALGATVIVENQPGAGGVSALNKFYTAPPDGLQMTLINGTAAGLSQIIGQSGVHYDLTKFGYLGLVSASPWVWLVNPTHPVVTTVQQALAPGMKIRWGGSGPVDGMSDGAAVTCEALQIDCKIVIGYKGTAEVALAVQRGEMDSIYLSDTSANNYVKSGQNKPVVTMARQKSRFFPNLPTIFEAVKLTPDQEWWFDFRATLDSLGRIMAVPPHMPAERLAYLQSVMQKVLSDPALIAEGEKSQRYIDFQDADNTRTLVTNAIANLSDEQKARVKKVVTEKFR